MTGNRSRGGRASRKPQLEALSARQMMAADLAAVDTGVDLLLQPDVLDSAAYFSRAIPSAGSLGTRLLDPAGGTRPVAANNGGFKIEIVPGIGLRNQFGALDAVHRAAAQWEAHLFDPITVTIQIDFAISQNPEFESVLGFAQPVEVKIPYDVVRGAMMGDGLTEGDDSILASLPAANQIDFALPPGFEFKNNISLTKANLKAIGLHNELFDDELGVADGKIGLNGLLSNRFDYNRADGIDPNKFDFESIVAHEIGHILGFVSAVDRVDQTPSIAARPVEVAPTTLDLFRFRSIAGTGNPRTPAAFGELRRELRPSTPAVFDFVVQDGWTTLLNEYPMELGEDTELIEFDPGELDLDLPVNFGYQASHWRDEDLFGRPIGIMGPIFAERTIAPISNVDLRALDLIGYDILPPGVAAAAPILVDDQVDRNFADRIVIDVLANDQNNMRPLVLSTFRIVEPAAGGLVTFDAATGFVVYEPEPGFFGQDLFTYTIADDRGLFGVPAVVTIDVTQAGSSPIAVDDFVLTRETRAVVIDPLINDIDVDSDLSLDLLSITLAPTNGVITREANTQRVIYTPRAGFVGEDSFEYTIRDEDGNSASATVRITVGQALPPVVTPGNPLVLAQRADVSGDSRVSAIDALMVINYLSSRSRAGNVQASTAGSDRYDVNGDGIVTALDALTIINSLSRQNVSQARDLSLLAAPVDEDE